MCVWDGGNQPAAGTIVLRMGHVCFSYRNLSIKPGTPNTHTVSRLSLINTPQVAFNSQVSHRLSLLALISGLFSQTSSNKRNGIQWEWICPAVLLLLEKMANKVGDCSVYVLKTSSCRQSDRNRRPPSSPHFYS